MVETRRDNASPIERFVHALIGDALRVGASDIHIEPGETGYQIRRRVDGVLQLTTLPPKDIAARLPTKIKVMANLDIAERRLPQDGRLHIPAQDHAAIDLRVSTLPTLWGEKIVLRLLGGGHQPQIESLGMDPDQQRLFLRTLAQPQGMILVTGPTGSGKTATLYGGLRHLNNDRLNITTAEDPVELYLPGVNQVAIRPRIGLDFARTLRAMLRQDPDIIMVGEIRDLETANMAVRAAHTGHLVLSTLHTSSALGTVERLIQMGIPAHSLASSISLIVAQRLLRRLCEHCKEPIASSSSCPQSGGQTYRAPVGGCSQCFDGYAGRLGIFELLEVSNVHFAPTHPSPPPALRDLYHHAERLVAAGITSREEVLRVLPTPALPQDSPG